MSGRIRPIRSPYTRTARRAFIVRTGDKMRLRKRPSARALPVGRAARRIDHNVFILSTAAPASRRAQSA